MTRFLASVRSAGEALVALAGGADIIDAKEPAAGALGRVPDAALATILRTVGGRRPVSATIGDLPLDPARVSDAVEAIAASGVDIVKIGIFAGALDATLEALRPIARRGVRLVAVIFADTAPELPRIVGACAHAGFLGVMLDTADKKSGPLLAHMTHAALVDFIASARSQGLLAGLAGSLRLGDIAGLAPLGADYLGFRSALTAGARAGALDLDAVRRVRRALGPELERVSLAPLLVMPGLDPGISLQSARDGRVKPGHDG